MKQLRQWLESIVFAGLRPSGPGNGQAGASAHPRGAFDALKARIDKFISGGPAPSDPLYLTNRTLGQKIRAWALIAVPILIVIAVIASAISQRTVPEQSRAPQIPPRELGAKMLPDMKNIQIEGNRSLDVLEARIEHAGALHMAGVVRNLTDHEIAAADIFCDLTDATGTQLGGVIAHVEKIPANGTKKFEVSLRQAEATAVLVREIVTR